LERVVVSAVDVVLVVVLAFLCFGAYALHKIKPGWLRINGSLWRLATFSMEVGRPGEPDKPKGEIEPDKPRRDGLWSA
jgi:hypothetical protein